MLLLIGAAIGLLLTLTGAGGSVLAVPLLSAGLHTSPTQVMGLSLGCVAMAAAPGALRGLYRRQIDLRLALPLALCGIVLAPVGRAVAMLLDPRLVTLLFAALAVFIAWQLWPRRQALPLGAAVAKPAVATARPLSNLASGACLGLVSGFFGVGGGFLIVPWLLRQRRLSAQQAIATSLLVIACVSASGYLFHLQQQTSWAPGLLLPLALGSLLGACLGMALAHRLHSGVAQRLVATAAMATALGLVLQTTWS
ncbi:sulfite exporter TauE/SafE family protein [Parahaliea mediterranea]|uniref:sulfite exporter TauE/SafE family protein n=1 Tax=Parahaliea mediterranea TaxID=651086 RepID=UPI000E2E45DF|nr:sulfite exporter TauE/SafE family protein [Parahaliea mediterranea]